MTAPHPEPIGCVAEPGYVKNNPLNNDYYVERFQGDPWYRIIKRTHERLEELIPGYNIRQIKEKFGGLRFYYDLPEEIPVKPEWPAFDSRDKIINMARSVVTYAEAWVDGYEAARKGAGS